MLVCSYMRNNRNRVGAHVAGEYVIASDHDCYVASSCFTRWGPEEVCRERTSIQAAMRDPPPEKRRPPWQPRSLEMVPSCSYLATTSLCGYPAGKYVHRWPSDSLPPGKGVAWQFTAFHTPEMYGSRSLTHLASKAFAEGTVPCTRNLCLTTSGVDRPIAAPSSPQFASQATRQAPQTPLQQHVV